jgi:hypothetical protein
MVTHANLLRWKRISCLVFSVIATHVIIFHTLKSRERITSGYISHKRFSISEKLLKSYLQTPKNQIVEPKKNIRFLYVHLTPCCSATTPTLKLFIMI